MNTKIILLVLSIEKQVSREIILCAKYSSKEYYIVGATTCLNTPHTHLCDKLLKLDSNISYSNQIMEICKEFKVSFILSGIEEDLIILSQLKSKLGEMGILCPVSKPAVIETLHNKRKCGKLFSGLNNCYANTETINNTLNQLKSIKFPVIVKPTYGYRSKDIALLENQESLKPYLNIKEGKEYIIQEFLENFEHRLECKPKIKNEIIQEKEYSFQIIIGCKKKSIGIFGSVNSLESGIPVIIETIDVRKYLDQLTPIINFLINYGVIGCINIQGIRVSEEKIKFFEINPRFTAMSSVRAELGFNELDILFEYFEQKLNEKRYFTDDGIIVHRYLKSDIVRNRTN